MKHPPFRPFFLLATIDAVAGGLVWLPAVLSKPDFIIASISAAEWHRAALLFGMVPATLSGFLLTAVPRWTGQPIASRRSVVSLLILWAASRIAFVVASPRLGMALAALLLIYLSMLVGRTVLAARDVRNVKIVLLLGAFSCSAALSGMAVEVELALRVALAAIVGLLMIIGGRLVPALASAYAEARASPFNPRRRVSIERGAAMAAAAALVLWAAAPQHLVTGAACAVAALAQLLRAAQWRSWRSGASAVVALHAGYGWIVAGFAMLAAHIYAPHAVASAAGIHAWTIGGLGTMEIAVMSSMIRRHSGRAFAKSPLATAAFLLMTLSCLARLSAELIPSDPAFWISLSGGLWVAAFISFLMSYGRQMYGLSEARHHLLDSRAGT